GKISRTAKNVFFRCSAYFPFTYYIIYSDFFMFIYDFLRLRVYVVFPIHFEPQSCWTNGTLVWYDLITGSVCYIFASGGSGHGDIGVVHLSWARIFAGWNPGPDPLC